MSVEAGLQAQLEYAERGCSCESYYKHVCGRCRQSIKGEAPDLKEAVKLGYVTWKGYGGPKLTEGGKSRLKEFRS